MPPIPIHKNDPISTTAAKPSGITPQTAAPDNLQPSRTTPLPAPATTASASPPAPQPGARPLAPTASTNTPVSSDPPPPQPGAAPQTGYTATHHVTETRLGGPPLQYMMPPPTDAQLAGRSTTTATQASKPGPTTLDTGPAPPGASPYQQEHTGGGVLPPPRSSLEGPPGYSQAPDNTPYGQGIGTGAQPSGEDEASVGGAAWTLLSKAGEALKKGEEAAWRAVRSNK